MSSQSNLLRGDLLILLSALIWGVAFYFQKTAMTHIGPLLFIGLRGCVAAMALVPFALFEQRRRRDLSVQLSSTVGGNNEPTSMVSMSTGLLPFACAGGCTFFIAGAIQQMGIVTATVTNTGFLTALYVVVTPFLYWAIKRQSPTLVVWLSAALALTGVWLLSGGQFASFSQGDILVAFSSLFWALLIIVSGEAARHEQPMSYTCVQFLVVGLLGLLAALLFEVIDKNAILQAMDSILYVGLLSTALTFGVMAVALQYVPAPRASILLSFETVFAAMAGYAWLGERLSVKGWAGAVLILSAVGLLQVRRRRHKN